MAGESGGPAPGEPALAQVIALKGWRRTMAERMAQSHAEHAQVTQMREVDALALSQLRQRLLAAADPAAGSKLTFTHLLVLALARALGQHPLLNSGIAGEELRLYADVNVSLAVALADGALVAPVIRQVQEKSLAEVAAAAVALAERARARRLRPDDLAGGTITLTNAGMYGTDYVTPLISAGQNAALGVGRIVAKPVVWEGQIAIRPRLGLSLAYDHRAITGAVAAQFFQTLQQVIEAPEGLA
jgi:pyruvate dehydrogenase E2 component (dihydrolipoamide acetyltransferase)